MKKYVSIFPYNGDQYLRNIAFDTKRNKGIEASIFKTLKKRLKKKGVDINTYDVIKGPPSKYVYFDIPYPWDIKAWIVLLSNRKKNILICNESALIIPFNYWRILHHLFTKVYTWYEPLIKGGKYRRIKLPKSSDGIETRPKKFRTKNFLVIINKNVGPFLPFQTFSFGKELYSERIKAIEFFDKNKPRDFYLYGRGWNKPKKHSQTEKLFGFKKYKTYKGEVDDKLKLLSSFKFSICFENLTGVDGYITEKIFDCLKARCVPIYWGATDIEKYIPKECFIDFRDFKDYDELLNFLESIDEERYDRYIGSMDKLLSDKKFRNLWFEEQFATFFMKEILEIKK